MILRPCLNVIVTGPAGWVPAAAILDSGADSSSIPLDFLEQLGFRMDDSEVQPVDTAAGESEEYTIPGGSVTVEFDDQAIELPAVFSVAPVVILGREDFFARYAVSFDQRDSTFRLASF